MMSQCALGITPHTQNTSQYSLELLLTIHWNESCHTNMQVATPPGHTQILSRSRGEKSGEGLGTL